MRALLLLAGLLVAAPAAAQDPGPVWTTRIDQTTASMNYAIPESEEVDLSLTCTRKTGQIRLMFPVETRLASTLRGSEWVDDLGRPAPWPVSVTVSSGAAQTTVRGEAHPDEMAGGSSIYVELSERAPVIQAFARTGVLRLIALGQSTAAPTAPKRDASRFTRSCR